jgi:glycerol-3-phosphate dehydrogenase
VWCGVSLKKTSVSYTGSDPIGLELAGALKNVYAIGAGIGAGLGYGNNTRASKSLSNLPLPPIFLKKTG